MYFVRLALRLLRIAGEALFCFEVNRFLGRAVGGCIKYRRHSLRKAEQILLQNVNAPVITFDITLSSGIRIHTLVAGAAVIKPLKTNQKSCINFDHHGGKPLVLLHGHSMAATFFFRNIDHFLEMGYTTLYCLDLPGWGSSSRPIFKGTNSDDAVNFFLEPFREWISKMKLSNFTLCGHSLGAYIAHEFTSRYPTYVNHLILTSPAAILRHTPFSQALWFAFTPQRFLTHGGLLAHLFFASKYPSNHVYNFLGFRQYTFNSNSIAHLSGDAAAAKMIRFCRTGLTSWKSECVRPLLERVRKIHCHIDLVTGDADDLVHVEAVRALCQSMQAMGNSVRIEVISGADHTPHICAPLSFAKAVMRGIPDVGSNGYKHIQKYLNNSPVSNLLLV